MKNLNNTERWRYNGVWHYLGTPLNTPPPSTITRSGLGPIVSYEGVCYDLIAQDTQNACLKERTAAGTLRLVTKELVRWVLSAEI